MRAWKQCCCFPKKTIFIYHWRVFTILSNNYEGCFFKNCQRLQAIHFFANFFFIDVFFPKMVNGYQPVNTFTNITIIDARQGLKYAFVAYQFHIGFTVLTITGWKVFAFGIFLVRLFLHTNWMRRFTLQLSVFSPSIGKYGPEKFRTRTLFAQLIVQCDWILSLDKIMN